MDFDEFDFVWVIETIRSHREATLQINALQPEERVAVAAPFARRRLVLGSQAFTEFVQLVKDQSDDLVRYRARQSTPLSPEEITALETGMTERLVRLRAKISSFKLLLET